TGVYPIVLFASGPQASAPQEVGLSSVIRSVAGELSMQRQAGIDPAWYGATTARAFFPQPEHPVLRQALRRLLRADDRHRLGDVLDLRWSVSFHRAGQREQLVSRQRPGDPSALPFLGGGRFSGNG